MEIININLIPSGVNPTCHAKQYDKGRVIRFELFNGLTPYTLQSGDTVTLNLRKPDNTIIEASVTAIEGNKYVDLVTTEQMTACFGYNYGCFKIANGEIDIGTLNFVMAVERDVIANGDPSQSSIKDLGTLVSQAVGEQYDSSNVIFDDAPTENHGDGYTVTSEGIKAALDDKADKPNTYMLVPSIEVPIDNSIVDENTTVTKTNVTGDYTNGFVFTSTSGSIEFEQASTDGELYIVVLTMSNFAQGKIFAAFGDDEPADVYFGESDTQIVLKGNGGNLKITNKSYSTTITNIKCYPVVVDSENTINLILDTTTNAASVNSGRWNVKLGDNNTLEHNINGTRCVAIGRAALESLITGSRNIGIGTFALERLQSGEFNIAIGSDSLWNAIKSKDCIAIGFNTMSGAGTDIEHNIAIGQDAMGAITTGKSNIAIGYGSMNSPQSNSVSYAVCMGQQAGNYANTNGTYIGNRAGYSLKGVNNTCLGASSGSQTNTTGSQNIFIGVQSGIDNTGATSSNPKTVDNSIAMGFQVKATKSNQMILGNANITEVVVCGNKKINFNNDGTVTWEEVT